MIALLAAAAWAQSMASHTITLRIVALPPPPPIHVEAGGPLPGHWLDTLSAEGWSSEWVSDAPPAPPPPTDEPEA